MMVMMVMADHFIRPAHRRQIDELGRERSADKADRSAITITGARHVCPLARGKPRHRLLAFAHDDKIGAELFESGSWRGRAMWTDGDENWRKIAHRTAKFLRHTQLRWGAPPEQVRWRGGHHGHVRGIGGELSGDIRQGQAEHVRV